MYTGYGADSSKWMLFERGSSRGMAVGYIRSGHLSGWHMVAGTEWPIACGISRFLRDCHREATTPADLLSNSAMRGGRAARTGKWLTATWGLAEGGRAHQRADGGGRRLPRRASPDYLQQTVASALDGSSYLVRSGSAAEEAGGASAKGLYLYRADAFGGGV